MEIFGLIFLVVALVLIGAGIAAGLVACLAAAMLLGLGIVSSSVAVGLHRQSVQAALRTLFVLGGIALGVPGGMVCAVVLGSILELDATQVVTLAAGGAGGALGGLLVALLLSYSSRRLLELATRREARDDGGNGQ